MQLRCAFALVFVLVACGRKAEQSEPSPVTPARDPGSASADAAPAVDAGAPTIDLTAIRRDLKGWAEQVCACKDVACADAAIRPFSIWEKELILQDGRPEYTAHVAAVKADAEITASRARIVECSRALRT
jgi:hypothetical protein